VIELIRLILVILLAWYWVNRLIRRHQLKQAARAAAEPEPFTGASIPDLARHITTSSAPFLDDTQSARLRPLVLHWLGLRTDLTQAQIAAQAPALLRQRWFTLDLQHPMTTGDPRAALAFACLRVTFYLRAAHLLGWLDETDSRQLAHLNARRIRDCFPDWPSFVHACLAGRAQWQSSGRTDIFGEHLHPDQLRGWLWLDAAGAR